MEKDFGRDFEFTQSLSLGEVRDYLTSSATLTNNALRFAIRRRRTTRYPPAVSSTASGKRSRNEIQVSLIAAHAYASRHREPIHHLRTLFTLRSSAYGYSCVYANTTSWAPPTVPRPWRSIRG